MEIAISTALSMHPLVYSEYFMDDSLLQNEPEVNREFSDRSGGGVGIKNYTVVFIFKLGWFVCLFSCFWMSFPDICALSVVGGGEEKQVTDLYRIGWGN